MQNNVLEPDVCRRMRSCVELCRAARRAPRKKNAADGEAESMLRAAQTLFEHAALNRMRPSFVSCDAIPRSGLGNNKSAEYSGASKRARVVDYKNKLDTWSETSEDSDGGGTRTRGGRRGRGDDDDDDDDDDGNDMRYVITVLFENTPESAKMHASALEVSSRAGKALNDYFSALQQRKRAKNAVAYDSVQGNFDAAKDAYQVQAYLWPPHDDAEPAAHAAASKKRKASAAEMHGRSAAARSAKMPSESDCVSFYSNKPHLWSAFGHDMGDLCEAVLNKQ